MRFKLFGIRFFVSFYFFAYITMLMLVDKTGILLPGVLSAAVHEMGHIIAMKRVGSGITGIHLAPGKCIITAPPFCSNKAQIKVALYGPMFNMASAFIFAAVWYVFGLFGCLAAAVINAALGLFNLLPAVGLDMGTVILCAIKPQNEGKFLLFSRLFVFVLSAAVVSFVIKGVIHFSAIILCFYLIYCTAAKI